MRTNQWIRLDIIERSIRNEEISAALSAVLDADRVGTLTQERMAKIYNSLSCDEIKAKFIEYIEKALEV